MNQIIQRRGSPRRAGRGGRVHGTILQAVSECRTLVQNGLYDPRNQNNMNFQGNQSLQNHYVVRHGNNKYTNWRGLFAIVSNCFDRDLEEHKMHYELIFAKQPMMISRIFFFLNTSSQISLQLYGSSSLTFIKAMIKKIKSAMRCL